MFPKHCGCSCGGCDAALPQEYESFFLLQFLFVIIAKITEKKSLQERKCILNESQRNSFKLCRKIMLKEEKVDASNKFHKPDTFNIMIYIHSPSFSLVC